MTSRSGKRQSPARQERKNGSRIYIDPSDFVLMRHRAFLKVGETARLLDVTPKTIENWERGRTRIPYTAFRVLKLKVGYVFDDEYFGEWFTRDNILWSPEGRAFYAHELRYIGSYFWMARQWLAERQAQNQLKATISAGAASNVSPAASATRHAAADGVAMAAVRRTSCDATPRREPLSVKDTSLVFKGKTPDFEKFLERLGIPA